MRRPHGNLVLRITPPPVLTILLVLGLAAAAQADPFPMDLRELTRGKSVVFSVGAAAVGFESTYKYTSDGSPGQMFISLEGDLGLPDTDVVPSLGVSVRLSDRSSVVGSYMRLDRETGSTLINRSVDTEDDVLAINAEASAYMNYDFIDLVYSYALTNDDRSAIRGVAGLHLFYFGSGFSMAGTFMVNDEAYEGELSSSGDFVAGFPKLGINNLFMIGRRWLIENVVEFVYLPIGDVQGAALSARMSSRFLISRTVGVQLGLSYNSERVEYKSEGTAQEVAFTYNGFSMNAYFAF